MFFFLQAQREKIWRNSGPGNFVEIHFVKKNNYVVCFNFKVLIFLLVFLVFVPLFQTTALGAPPSTWVSSRAGGLTGVRK